MRTSRINKPQVIITMGDPAGIGPEIIVKSVASRSIRRLATFVITGDSGLFKRLLRRAGIKDAVFHEPGDISGDGFCSRRINIVDPGQVLKNIKSGNPSAEGAKKALDCIDAAVTLDRKSVV